MLVLWYSNLCQVGFCLPPRIFQCYLPPPPTHKGTHTNVTHVHTHTLPPCFSFLELLSGGTVKASSVPFLCRAALSCRISLLTQSCHGLRGLKMAMQRSKKWNSKNKPLVYFRCVYADACVYLYLYARLSGWERARMCGNFCRFCMS